VKETPGPSPAPTNPRWVKITVIALIALVWIGAVVSIVSGESWVEAGFAALIATLCLSAVDLGIDLSRKKTS
jgi:hypothetical protein